MFNKIIKAVKIFILANVVFWVFVGAILWDIASIYINHYF
jgi:hypothetical protein